MKSDPPAPGAPPDPALARLERYQRMLDQIAADAVRMSEMLLKQIKAGAPDTAALMASYDLLTREVLRTTAYRRKLQQDAARIAAGDRDGAGGHAPSPWETIANRLRTRLERDFFADALARPSAKPDRLH